MTRLLPGLVFCFAIFISVSGSGCASSPKVAEYQELQNNVSSLHENSVFKDDGQRLFTPSNVDDFQSRFSQSQCTHGMSDQECGMQFKRAALGRLSEIYFAANTSDVMATCENEPLICDDLVSLETLFRRLHNASVETSKQEKLSQIENWRQGKLTEEQLKKALHLDFKFENGRLVLGTPSA
jgi:hypothetical protein